MNTYEKLRCLAKSNKAQNLFLAVKELNGLTLFRNSNDLSKLQELYLSYLYLYDAINHDIVIDKISDKIFDYELYEDAYILWKNKGRKQVKKEDKNKQKELHLVVGNTINFPKRG